MVSLVEEAVVVGEEGGEVGDEVVGERAVCAGVVCTPKMVEVLVAGER